MKTSHMYSGSDETPTLDINLMLGDCLERMKTLQDNSIDAVVTDPPYGLSFMGKKWDYDVPSEEIWRECLRVLKPGGHLLAFAGTRTQHRMAARIEDAGFEIRDMIGWIYGSGFPKSHNLDGEHKGWGTALKPAMEPITVARKPFKGTVAANVQEYGTGAINVDGCRVGMEDNLAGGCYAELPDLPDGNIYGKGIHKRSKGEFRQPAGRWPANLIHDGSDEVVGLFPVTTSGVKPARTGKRGGCGFGMFDDAKSASSTGNWPADNGGSAARFFYCAKASKADRDEGCEGMEERACGTMDDDNYQWRDDVPNGRSQHKPVRRNHHPTVKPTDLMRYLCRLVTPPKGTVLDPFMGSGSTGKAAVMEGFRFAGIEREQEYFNIAKERIASAKHDLFRQ